MYDLKLPVLGPGSTGTAVIILQMMLYDIYRDRIRITIDGDYGQETESAIEVFQQTNNLTVDGICGPDETWPAVIRIWWEGL